MEKRTSVHEGPRKFCPAPGRALEILVASCACVMGTDRYSNYASPEYWGFCRAGQPRLSDHLLSPMLEQVLEQIDVLPDSVQIGIDFQCTARIFERTIVIFEAGVDQGVAGERAEVVRVALHDLVAVG